MPQAQGDFLPVTGLLPNHKIDLQCTESDSELFEEAQGTIELPLSQSSTASTVSNISSDSNNVEMMGDLGLLMDTVKCEYSQRPNMVPHQYSTAARSSHTENMAARLNPVTPTKPKDENGAELDPLTPTANMKLLMSAVSPELRNREKEQRKTEKQRNEQVKVEANNNYIAAVPPVQKGIKRKASQMDDVDEEDTQASGRKEKSLGLLCQRFMSRYNPFPPADEPRIEICLDVVAKELGVERRRIYDIVNVLESVEMMSRLAKNKYVWHGGNNLLTTLAKLKALGYEEGFHESIEKMKDFELSKDLQNIKKSPTDSAARFDNMMKESLRKDRSLGIMSQRFLMLFLVAKNQAINLDLAAKILVGDPHIDKTESGKFKTQIRRLYDIANILQSLELIKKVHVTEVRGRKPAFKYSGPTVQDLPQPIPLSGFSTVAPVTSACSSTMTRNSLLIGRQNQKLCGLLNNKTSLRRTMSQQVIRKKDASQVTVNQKFSRHASFEMMCEIAEGERKRLYYESQTEKAVSQSQPSSPLKGKIVGLRGTVKKSEISKAKQNLFSSLTLDTPQSSPTVRSAIKRYVIVNNSAQHSCTTDSESSQESDVSEAVSLSPSEATAVHSQGDQILLKAHLSHPNLRDKQPTLLKLSKTQLQSVLKSMSQNPASTVSSSDYKVASPSGLTTTQAEDQNGKQVQLLHVNINKKQPKTSSDGQDILVSPPDMSRVRNRKRLVEDGEDSSAVECYFDAKRPKREAESSDRSPPVDSEVAAINGQHPLSKVVNATKPRPSPLRALHLDPEFQSARNGELSPPVQHSPLQQVMVSSQPNVKTAPMQLPSGILKHTGLMRSKTASTFMFGGKGVGSLQSEALPVQNQPNGYASIVSPLNGCAINGPQITAQVISTDGGYQITPTSSIRPSRNIVPSSGAILNLVPHLQSSTAQDVNCNVTRNVKTIPVSALSMGGARILSRNLSADQITARARPAQPQQPKVISVPVNGANNIQAQTQFFRVDTQGILQTPTQHQQHQFATQIISPSLNNTTPSTQLATPKSFFQSTPSGSLIRITTHQISPSELVQQQQVSSSAVSAFRVVNGQTFAPITETVTARRLTLTAEQTP